MSLYAAKEIPSQYLAYKIKIMKKAFLVIFALSFATLLFSKEFSFGFFVGGFISVANFLLLWKNILKMREFSLNKAKRFIISKFLVMYFIMGLALFIGITKGVLAFAGVATGLLVIKFAIFIDGMFVRYEPS